MLVNLFSTPNNSFLLEINKTTSLEPRSIGSGGIQADKPTQASTVGLVTVREEEIVIVAIVLAFWVAVILVFFNKWGKIRMLEPYQPQYRVGMDDVAPYSPTGGPKARVSVSDPIGTGTVQVHVFDRDQSRYSPTPSYRLNRLRQNSVFIGNAYGSKAYIMQDSETIPRKFKSEENLKSLVVQITNCDEDDDPSGETSPL